MKLFASGLAYRLSELGKDGYSADSDKIMKACEAFRASKYNDRHVELGLPEYQDVCSRYKRDAGVFRGSGEYKYVQQGSILQRVLDYSVNCESQLYGTLIAGLNEFWTRAHANAVVNAIYGMHLPEIESFITLNDGSFNEILECLYGGADNPNASVLFPVARSGKERELHRELSEDEVMELRCKYYKTDTETMLAYKDRLLQQIRDEWESFVVREVNVWRSLEPC